MSALEALVLAGKGLIPSSSAQIPMSICICISQSLFSHSYVVNEWLNRHCNVRIDIGIRADELGINAFLVYILALQNWHISNANQHLITENHYFSNAVFLSLDTQADLDLVVFTEQTFQSCLNFFPWNGRNEPKETKNQKKKKKPAAPLENSFLNLEIYNNATFGQISRNLSSKN
jgi:hypothetical protein